MVGPEFVNNYRILIVEDEPLIAMEIEDALNEANFTIAGVVSSVADAIALIERGDCEGAVLDANLFGKSSAPIAEALTAQRIPYVVLSGYIAEQLPKALQSAPFVPKPLRFQQLQSALNALFPKRS